MTFRHSIHWAMAASLALCATGAQAAEQSCMTRAQLADLVVVATPAALGTMRQQCGTAFAPDSPLKDATGPLTVKYEAAAKEAWPRAKDALIVASAGRASADERKRIGDAMTPAVVGTFMAPLVAKALTPAVCADADRVATLLAPLPPANFGALVATLVELGEKRSKGGNSPLHLCGV